MTYFTFPCNKQVYSRFFSFFFPPKGEPRGGHSPVHVVPEFKYSFNRLMRNGEKDLSVELSVERDAAAARDRVPPGGRLHLLTYSLNTYNFHPWESVNGGGNIRRRNMDNRQTMKIFALVPEGTPADYYFALTMTPLIQEEYHGHSEESAEESEQPKFEYDNRWTSSSSEDDTFYGR